MENPAPAREVLAYHPRLLLSEPMKLVLLFAALLISGCASSPLQQQAAEFKAWVQQSQSLARAGQLKYSDFYTQAYERLKLIDGGGPDKLALQRGYAEMIPVARAFEQGQITQDQFGDARRLTEMALAERQETSEAQRRRAVAAAMNQAAENMRRSQPVQTNCTRFGNQVNCVTR